MATNIKVERRKQQRRLNRSKIRQVLFVAEYIQYKYFDIYSEAAEFYNALNTQYPKKYDLRKTDEYKDWKSTITGEVVRGPKRPKPSHPNIQTPIEIHPQAQITVTYEDSQPSSPDLSEEPLTPGTEEPQPSSPDLSEEPLTPCTREPQPSSPDLSEEPLTPCTREPQPSSPDLSEEPLTPCTRESQPTSPVELPSRKHIYTDNFQLRIPLICHKSITPTNRCTVTTETLQTVTEEILEEDTLQPSLYEELAPELIEKIIEELRSEPDLHDIVTNIEQQIEFEELGMDIDIDIEDNALDIELDQW